MRRLWCALLIFAVLWPCGAAQAVPPDFSGGVNNEYEYQEMVFLSGEPLLFKGTFTTSEKSSADAKTVSYKFDLKPVDNTIKGQLDRRVTYETAYTRFADQGQTTGQTIVKSYRETVSIGDDKFSLEDYQFSKSDIVDNRPASDFYSGTVTARKYYEVNKDKGTVIVDMNGGTTGYSNFWGSTETQVLDYTLQSNRSVEDEESEQTTDYSWDGTVRIMASDSRQKSFNYASNGVTLSSFSGGNMIVTNQDMYSSYDYDLPQVNDGLPDSSERNNSQQQLHQAMLPKVERLIVPKFRDLGGHWAQEDIEKLYSLNVFQGQSAFFLPDVPMTRMDFIRAVMRACSIQAEAPQKTTRTRTRSTSAEASVVQDVPVADPNYTYVKEAINQGLVQGSGGYFLPAESLTRAQAITILVRALGFDYNAPAPGYTTSFVDDASIPSWARDSFYMASQMGLLTGDASNRAYPNRAMTRAEASALLVRFLGFLEKDLQKDYRENIMLYQ